MSWASPADNGATDIAPLAIDPGRYLSHRRTRSFVRRSADHTRFRMAPSPLAPLAVLVLNHVEGLLPALDSRDSPPPIPLDGGRCRAARRSRGATPRCGSLCLIEAGKPDRSYEERTAAWRARGRPPACSLSENCVPAMRDRPHRRFPPSSMMLATRTTTRWEIRKPKSRLLGRVPDYEFGGQEFESLRARQLNQKLRMVLPIDPVGLRSSRVHNQVHDRAGVRTRSCRRPLWSSSAHCALSYLAWGCF